MSNQILSIIEAVRNLDADQRLELRVALAELEDSPETMSASRKELVDSIRGKYRHIPTSSESFLDRKREDTLLESQQ